MDWLALHRELVGIPSISHDEERIASRVHEVLRSLGGSVERIGKNCVARTGEGPLLLFCSHYDTVPPNDGWTRDPWKVEVADGRVYGLGSNDAKASVVAMIATYAAALRGDLPVSVGLLLVADEETGGEGAEVAWPELRDRGWDPAGVVVGEPTGLDVASAQRGLLLIELFADGDPCHAANADALGARNPIRDVAFDLAALEGFDTGPVDPLLGRATMQPTVLKSGEARNQVPAQAYAHLDLRTTPSTPHPELISRIESVVERSRVHVRSSRLAPYACPDGAHIVEAAREVRPDARVYGSRTMSDMVWFQGFPAIKCGPGQTERSHRADEFVLESEILEGQRFYGELLHAFARRVTEGAR